MLCVNRARGRRWGAFAVQPRAESSVAEFRHAAVRAIREMVKAPGHDRRMLLLATQLAHERDLKPLLVAVLDALLADVRAQKGVDNEIEGVTLIR